jgi:hypothetical protein
MDTLGFILSDVGTTEWISRGEGITRFVHLRGH